MSSAPKISIVTPTFNQGKFIEQTIQSVLNQKYPNLEYIIIDGGSTDETVNIIKKYENHLTYWVSEKDRGQSHAINKGLARCTGDIFNWINSDDYYEGKVFEKVAAAFYEGKTKMYCGRSHIFGGEREWISEGTQIPDDINCEWKQPVIDQPATFFSMEIVRELGNLKEELHYTMDLEWLMKFWISYGKEGVKESDNILINFREHPGSKTVNFQNKFTTERVKLYKNLIEKIEGKAGDNNYFRDDIVKIEKELIYKTVNDFIYNEIIVSYGEKNLSRIKELSSLIRFDYLTEKQKNEFKKINKRVKIFSFIPIGLIRKQK